MLDYDNQFRFTNERYNYDLGDTFILVTLHILASKWSFCACTCVDKRPWLSNESIVVGNIFYRNGDQVCRNSYKSYSSKLKSM